MWPTVPHHHLHFLLMLMPSKIEDPFPVLFKCFLRVHWKFTGHKSQKTIVLSDSAWSHQETLALLLSGKGRNFHLFRSYYNV